MDVFIIPPFSPFYHLLGNQSALWERQVSASNRLMCGKVFCLPDYIVAYFISLGTYLLKIVFCLKENTKFV